MATSAPKRSKRIGQKKTTRSASRKATPQDDKSLIDEIALIHLRIEEILAAGYKKKGGPGEADWDEVWKLVDRKAHLVEVENNRQLVLQNARMNDLLEQLQSALTDSKTNEQDS